MAKRIISRRAALSGLLTLGAGAASLAACGATPTPQVVERVVEKEVTKIVEGTAQVVVETVIVKETVVVESGAQTSEPIIIRFHGRLGTQGDHFDAFAQKFNNDHAPDVIVKTEHFPGGDYYQKLNTLIAGGTVGDGFWIYLGGGFERYAATGVYAAHEPMVEAMSYDLGQFYPEAVENSKWDGTLYGLPWCLHFGCGNILYYNKPMLDAAAVAYPDETWTFDDLRMAAQALTNLDESVYGFVASTSTCAGMIHYPRAWGGDITNPEGTQCILDSEDAMAGLQVLADHFFVDKVSPLPSQVQEGWNQMFAANKLAMFTSGFWGKGVGDFVAPGVWAAAPSPKGPAGRGHVFYIDINGVTANSKHPQEMFEYITYLSSFEAGMDIYQVRKSIPGARPDVWESEAALADPHFQAAAWTVKEGLPAKQWGPANFRDSEYLSALQEGLDPVWLGEAQLSEVIGDVVSRAQSVLDMPTL